MNSATSATTTTITSTTVSKKDENEKTNNVAAPPPPPPPPATPTLSPVTVKESENNGSPATEPKEKQGKHVDQVVAVKPAPSEIPKITTSCAGFPIFWMGLRTCDDDDDDDDNNTCTHMKKSARKGKTSDHNHYVGAAVDTGDDDDVNKQLKLENDDNKKCWHAGIVERLLLCGLFLLLIFLTAIVFLYAMVEELRNEIRSLKAPSSGPASTSST